jgi:predicted ATP-grasp superfamily ATP-dependent carboligase
VERENVDLIWPTCEEVFYLAEARHELPCPVLCPSLEILTGLHDKLTFAQWTRDLGHQVSAPDSWNAVDAPGNLDLVWKPKYSRFGTRTRFNSPAGELDEWMAQKRVDGPEFSSWALCQKGMVRIMTQYRCPVRAFGRAGCSFEPMWCDAVAQFVQEAVSSTNYTGCVAFDFIGPDADGRIYVIECNPRMTSGLHVLDPSIPLRGVAQESFIGPEHQRKAQLFLITLANTPHLANWKEDVIHHSIDPWPMAGQLLSLAEFGGIAIQRGISLSEATTWDLEWNG